MVAAEGEGRPELHLLRPGPIVKQDLQEFGKVIRPKKKSKRVLELEKKERGLATTDSENGSAMEAPGMSDSHYAPRVPLYIFDKPEDFVPIEGLSYGLLSYRGQAKDGYTELHDWEEMEELSPGKGKLGEAAVRLFYVLRMLDESGVDAIVAETVAETGLGVAINDRLRRASSTPPEAV